MGDMGPGRLEAALAYVRGNAMTHADANRLFYDYLWPHRAMVLRTARFLTRGSAGGAEADDLAQETMVKAFKSISQFDPNSNGKAWLAAILRNTWIDRRRAAGRHGELTSVSVEGEELEIADGRAGDAEADVTDPAALLERFSDADLIAALKTLPEEIRWTLMLVEVEGLDHADAARILGIPAGTVKSRSHRGRQMLRERLTGQGKAQDTGTFTEGRS
jgi:RNA polymerase sigma-70 factor (ECF subfamily)